MGAIIDKFKPKKGGSKFKPFIFWGAIALVVSGAMVFLPVQKAPDFVKILEQAVGPENVMRMGEGDIIQLLTFLMDQWQMLSQMFQKKELHYQCGVLLVL